MREKLLAANWKMYKTPDQTSAFFREFLLMVAGHDRDEIAVFPPFIDLPVAAEALQRSNIAIGGQDLYWAKEGAFTGAISPAMLLALGCTHVITALCERRPYFGDATDTVKLKRNAALLAR